jgi:uncharacterized protein
MVKRNQEFQVFVKPAGSKCNLNCSYCYYLGRGADPAVGGIKLMTDSLLEKYIVQHIDASPVNEIFFSWHGGEPLLAGIEFYRKAVALQEKHRPEGYKIINGIQTNATLIDEEWAVFLAENSFYTGVSIDGQHSIHDAYRKSPAGTPSFFRTFEGYLKLVEKGVRPEILCVVNALNARHPGKTYRFLKSLGAQFITFIPLVNRSSSEPGSATPDSVTAEDFGRFLCSVFDIWVEEDIGRIKIQIIEEALRTAFHKEHTLCIFRRTCGGVPVIDLNGDFYSCDHYVDSMHLAGNLNDSSLTELLDSDIQLGFGEAKLKTLPGYCLECEVLNMCNGECPKNRFISTPDGEQGLNYLCAGYKTFFSHILPFAAAVRSEWQRGGG